MKNWYTNALLLLPYLHLALANDAAAAAAPAAAPAAPTLKQEHKDFVAPTCEEPDGCLQNVQELGQDAASVVDVELDGHHPYEYDEGHAEETFHEDDDEETDDDDEESSPGTYFWHKVYDKTRYTLDDFTVNGINLASYGKQPLFELYEDFDVSSFIRGDEDWDGLLSYRNRLERPSLSFYVDKVARKRWLPAMGFPQPNVHLLAYADELTESGEVSEQSDVIYEALPDTGFFAAKPTHMSLTQGTWLVDRHEDGTTRFSLSAKALQEDHGDDKFDARRCANDLATSLHDGPDEIESWALKNVRPGLVVEERWAAHDLPDSPPHEFNMFTIWGRVWVGQWNSVDTESRWCNGFVYRNRTMADRSNSLPADFELPEWVPWEELVEIAERLGAHKDMFRTDIFVGRPAGSDPDAPLEVAVSESEIFPTTVFPNDDLSQEGARLWIAGYQMGIYEKVENSEIPLEFLHEGKLSA